MPDLDPNAAAPEAPDPAAEHASAFLERAAVRAGITPEAEPSEPAEAVATRETAPREHVRQEPHTADRSQAQERWAERNERRRQEADARARDRVLAELSDRLAKMEVPAEAAAPPAPGEADPEPDMHEDYGAWMAWRDRRLEQRLTEQITGKLDPILQHLDGQRRESEQSAQARQREQETRGWLSQREQVAREAHEMYVATPEGEGFSERLTLIFGHPGRAGDPTRGIEAVEPYDGAMTLGLVRGGVDLKSARLMALANYRALHEFAEHRQLSPAVLVDSLMRTEMEAAAHYYGSQGQPRRAPAEQAKPNTEARRMRETAKAAAGVTGSAVDAPAPTGQRDLRQILSSGEITPEKVREVAKARGITVSAAARQLRQVADEMRRAG